MIKLKGRLKSISSIKLFLLLFVLCSILFITWSMSQPIGSEPDEASNSIYAASVVRGNIFLKYYSITPLPIWETKAPKWVSDLYNAALIDDGAFDTGFSQNPNNYIKPNSNQLVHTTTDLAVLPPFYYFATGIPTLFNGGLPNLFAMRIISSLMSGFYLALSIWVILRYKMHPISYSAIFFSIFPEAYMMASAVNPNGLEVIGTLCLTVLTAVIITENTSKMSVIKLWLIVAALLSLTKTLSPLWVLICAIYIVIGIGFKPAIKMIVAKENRVYSVVTLLFALSTFIWDLLWGRFPYPIVFYLTNNYRNYSFFQRLYISITRFPLYLNTGFDKIRESSSNEMSIAWSCLMIIVLIIGLSVTNMRQRIIIILSIALAIILPAIVEASQGAVLGEWWKGRYADALYVNTPILTLMFIGKQLKHFPPKNQLAKVLSKTKIVLPLTLLLVSLVFEFDSLFNSIKVYMRGIKGSNNIFVNTNTAWATYPYGWQDVWLVSNLLVCIVAIYLLFKLFKSEKVNLTEIKHSNLNENII